MASLSGNCPGINHWTVHTPRPEDLHRVYLRTVEDTDEVSDTLLSILRQPALGQYVRHVEMDRAL
ncbi:hypothetical protein BDV40DRAFT_251367 [Aspergillus tamarii]|uniref:Uncharacterized protein n=1 Tax=Aspergillus tamarii TaxID=41984 RepID=A0A5N6VAU3_ASPTM|nr:hypothetical protein BDV40DRAFT_251367 [Aspergillus tamarii]